MNIKDIKIGIIGLGYVGLPLAVEFGKKRQVYGFDINEDRIQQLKQGFDATKETTEEELISAKKLNFTNDISDISNCNFYIVTVPSPIDKYNRPDLIPLINASKLLGRILNKGDIVVYESTVYPGCTEEDCVPILEKYSGLKFNRDFHCGYSPERINPGDQEHRLTTIKKITSGSTPATAEIIDSLYNEIIKAGTHMASSIKIAEAAKVIENTQRDLNIALINELSIIFNKLNIDTHDVLKAAETKWNFLPFKPGLVGGHCIGVDPYYLTHKAESLGYHSEVILSGRRINDSMGVYAASQFVKAMLKKEITLTGLKVLILGFGFKENCSDLRNTKVIDIVNELSEYGIKVDVHDPLINKDEARSEYGIELLDNPKNMTYDGIILAVAHDVYKEMGVQYIKKYGRKNHLFYDLKSVFDINESDLRL